MSTAPSRAPYVGLSAFREEDADLFFGRRRETRVVAANLLAARLSLLFGPAGVGKSSLVRAGVAARLRARADQPVVIFADWHADPVAGIKQGVARELARLSRELPAEAFGLALDEFLAVAGRDLPAPLVVILDQFDDYLLYAQTSDLTHSFEEQFARAVNRRDCLVHHLLVVRDDVLARLDRLSGRIPVLFNNRLQLERLSEAAAREAITEPVRVYNEQRGGARPVKIEPELAKAILVQVRATDDVARPTGLAPQGGRVPAQQPAGDEIHVEAPYLQLVLTRLWEADVERGTDTLRARTLESLGGTAGILQQHVDATMRMLGADEREVAARVFRFLVAPSGKSNAYSALELANYAEVPRGEVEAVLNRLAQGDVRILRAVPALEGDGAGLRYEVSFDVLASAALVWRARYIALGSHRWRGMGLALAAVAAGVALVEVLVKPPSPVLFATRGLAILVLSSLMLVQVYRWFLRYVSMTGFLSIRTYRSPAIGVGLAVLLSVLWYSSTGFVGSGAAAIGSDWPGRIDRSGFAMYLFTILITLAVGAIAFTSMQFLGQVTAGRFQSFDAGLYAGVVAWALVILGVIALEATGRLAPWIRLSASLLAG